MTTVPPGLATRAAFCTTNLGSRIFQLAPLNSATIGLIWASNAEGDRPAEDARAIESLMTEELTRKIVAWATEIANYAAELPSSRTRDAYLAERRRELIVVPENSIRRGFAR